MYTTRRMSDLTTASTAEVISTLNIHDGHIDCPICGIPMETSETAEKSALYTHFYSKKHDGLRPLDGDFEGALKTEITRVGRAHKKRKRAAIKAAKAEEKAAQRAEKARLKQMHAVSGGFLDDIVAEMEVLIDMMEPYFSQDDGDRDARDMISRIREISGQPEN